MAALSRVQSSGHNYCNQFQGLSSSREAWPVGSSENGY